MRTGLSLAIVPVVIMCAVGWAAAADSSNLTGIHWWGYYDYGVVDSAPASVLDSAHGGAWDVEVVNTHGDPWQQAWFYQPLLQDLYQNKNVTMLTRVEYKYGETVPAPADMSSSTWANTHVVPLVSTLKDGGHWWQLGNEPNLLGEGGDWPGNQIAPSAYAQIYKDVRTAVRNNSTVGAPGAHKLLLAPVSPGGIINGVRWMSGDDWLGQTIDAVSALGTPIDGVAIHAYGFGWQDFLASISEQMSVIDAHGLGNVPVFITEWNRYTDPHSADKNNQEAITADFVRQAYQRVDLWNRTLGNHNVEGMCWFVYDSGDRNPTADSQWAGYSIKYWGNDGNPAGSSGDLFTAYQDVAHHHYAAGIAGARAIPSNIHILDNFEAGEANGGLGHFNKSLTFASSGSRYGFDTGLSSVSRDAGASFSKAWGEKFQIYWDNIDSRGWQIRHVSGDSTPATNTPIPIPTNSAAAYLGFFMRTASPGVSVQIVVDSNGLNGGVNTDAGQQRTVIADDEWHWYEWDLLSPADWVPFTLASGSDGVIAQPGGSVTVDSIMIDGPEANVTIWFDFVGYNDIGSLGAMIVPPPPVPEPGAVGVLIAAAGLVVLRRRR